LAQLPPSRLSLARPKLTMTLLVRNEADILADNIRFHHALGVDSFIVMDNLSTDATQDVLARLQQELPELRIDVWAQDDDDYNQGLWVTQMARAAAQDHGADWVINNDADEFWLPESGTLKTFCAALSADISVVEVQRHNAVLCAPAGAEANVACHPHLTEVFEAQSRNALGHPLPGKVLHRASASVTVAQGNHSVSGLDGQRTEAGNGLKILHYPYRTLPHYKDKIRLGGAAYVRNTTLAAGIGGTWRAHYKGLDTGLVDRFWSDLCCTVEDQTIALRMGRYFTETRVRAHLAPSPLTSVRQRFLQETKQRVDGFSHAQANLIGRVPAELQPDRPMYYNLRFAINGAERHYAQLSALTDGSDPKAVGAAFPALRDAFSLFPRNVAFRPFLAELLELTHAKEVARLREACAGKKIILHTSCLPRLADSQETIASFQPIGEACAHVVLLGEPGQRHEDAVPLGFEFDGSVLRVPVPDNYESLHRKLFYAYLLLDILAAPSGVVKLDDNLILQDSAAFLAFLEQVKGADYAGRLVGGARHDGQWHGWHIGKCADPRIETRGYQYPLPRAYAAGGHGYVLGPKGLSACAYMYLAMKEFFAMPAVGLEDACVGHAAYAQGIDLMDISQPGNLLALPGLTTKERRRVLEHRSRDLETE